MDRRKINSVIYVRLYCRCPVCVERGYYPEPHYWQHNASGGDMYIGDNATLFCEMDGTVIPVTQAEFFCPNHSASNGFFVKHGLTAHTDIFSIITGKLVQSVGLEWTQKFLNNLLNQEKTYNHGTVIYRCKDIEILGSRHKLS